MGCVTVKLTENALAFLREKVGGKRVGAGAFLSSLLTAEQAREEMRRVLAQQPAKATRQSWSETGVRVD